MKNINIDQLEDLRDEMDEMVMESKEINDLLNRDYTVDVDEDELDAELKELDDEMFFDALDTKKEPAQQNKNESKDYYAEIMNSGKQTN